MSSTMLYTVGTALNRARDHGVTVRVLVTGQWIDGLVSDLDGQGVVIAGTGSQHSVVRLDDISAVQVDSEGPLAEPPPHEEPVREHPAPRSHPAPHPHPQPAEHAGGAPRLLTISAH